MVTKRIVAAKLVRTATTANGVNPWLMASLPKTGASPRKNAELNAANTPAVCFLCKYTALYVRSYERTSFDKRFYFFKELVVKEITFLHQ